MTEKTIKNEQLPREANDAALSRTGTAAFPPAPAHSRRTPTGSQAQAYDRFAEKLIQNSAVATFVLSPDHKVILWNRACEELTGVPAARVVGTNDHWKPFYPQKRQTLADIIIDGNAESLSLLYTQHSRSSLIADGLHAEGWYRNLNGKDRYIIFDASPIHDGDGALAMVVETLQDINSMQERLRSAEKMEVVGKLAAGVAHEVRNPLNAIMVLSEAISKDLGGDPGYQSYLDHIRTQVNRLSGLMQDLLDLGKPVEPPDMRRESLTDICAASIDIWKNSGVPRSHLVLLSPPPSCEDITVLADARRMQQVLYNLLDNAAQHAPKGSEIRIAIDEPGGGRGRLRIVDQGPGIAAGLHARIFEPFFSTRKGGTGLGMSIVKHIVEAHGGSVAVQNNDPPPGCTVEIRLPVAETGQP